MRKKTQKLLQAVRHFRRGSVLIIVVVLLLMLAILGTVYLTTSRTDRLNSAQNLLNAQADMNAEGIGNAVGGTLVDDLDDPFGNFRRASVSTPAQRSIYQGVYSVTQTYVQGDIVSDGPTSPKFYWLAAASATGAPPGNGWAETTYLGVTASAAQPWLADRIPSLYPDPTVAISTSNAPGWLHLTQSIPTGTAYTSILPSQPFESPQNTQMFGPATVGQPITAALYPTFGTLANGSTVPALTTDLTLATFTDQKFVVAGDADGDGIADSLLFRIPGAFSDGLTWYAGVRIIDDNSAINVNTAWSRDQDYDFASTPVALPNWGFFPSNIGLMEMLDGTDTINTLNKFRFNSTVATPIAGELSTAYTATSVATPYDETGVVPPAPPTARTDFAYITQGDAFFNSSGRRLVNPGYNVGSARLRYQTLPLSETASLASHFVLTSGSSSQSLLESLLPNSLVGPSATPFPSTAFTAVIPWWTDNFAYPASPATNSMPLRPLLVSRNPVSNYISPVYDPNNAGEPLNVISGSSAVLPDGSFMTGAMMLPYGATPSTNHYRGQFVLNGATPYQFNDIVLCNPSNTTDFKPTATQPGYTFICTYTAPATPTTVLQAPATVTGGIMTVTTGWQLQPFSSHPTKANVNTASFRELYRAFWSVMAGNPGNETPYGAGTGSAWFTLGTPYTPTGANANPFRQFRTPIRDCSVNATTAPLGFTWMDSSNTMLLRAAIAAVNTLGMRDQTQDVISRTVYLMANVNFNPALGGAPAPTAVQARVYSSEPQPIISEVYADNDNSGGTPNPAGYVAIELYNPYQTALTLNHWQLACINRSGTGYPNLQFTVDATTGNSIIGPDFYPQNTPPGATGTPTKDIISIPPNGYALLENFNAQAGSGNGLAALADDAAGRPAAAFPTPSTTLPVAVWSGPAAVNNTTDVYVPHLARVITSTTATSGGEVVLLRARRADGTYTACADPLNTFSETAPFTVGATTFTVPNLVDMVPVDSYDFTGLIQTGGTPSFNYWSYIRNKGTGGAGDFNFKGTYAGAYTGNNNGGGPRQSGTENVVNTSLFTVAPAFGVAQQANDAASRTFPPIQIYSSGMPGPNPQFAPGSNNPTYTGPGVATPEAAEFPFGTFARNADMLNIPYIGAYRLQIATTLSTNQVGTGTTSAEAPFLELNSLPMDCSFADDADVTDDSFESIGRFCPVTARAVGTIPATEYYGWAANIFSYLTVQSNNDDYAPTFDSSDYDATTPAAGASATTTPPTAGLTTTTPPATKYPPASGIPPYLPAAMPSGQGTTPPTYPQTATTPLLNRDGAATDQTQQDNVGVDGLININTASWKVLSMLPMITAKESPTTWQADNERLAQVIVAWRDGGNVNAHIYNAHGPFMSIFDLNKVVSQDASPNVGVVNCFQTAGGWLDVTKEGTAPTGTGAAYPSSWCGLLFPPEPTFPKVASASTAAQIPSCTEDYQGDYAVLNRISNLITTKSDTFTVYIVVEGWQNAGTSTAQLKVTRRYSFVADRSAINQDISTRFLRTLTVPNN